MYSEAKRPTKEIGILADMNDCSRKEIKEAIRRQQNKRSETKVIEKVESGNLTSRSIAEYV